VTDFTVKDPVMANRIRRLPEYLFARINLLKARARARGVDVIDFGMGNPDRPPPDFIVEKLCEVARDSKAHRYSASRGIPHLRREIARRYKDMYGVTLDPETETVVTIGSKEGLTHLMFAVLNEGDTVVVPSPTYPIHTFGVLLAGGNLVTVPLGNPADLVERLAQTVESLVPKPKMLLLSFPHNPTSATVDPDFFVSVVRLARERGLMVIHDLAYADLVFDGYKAPSFLMSPGAKDIGVEFFSMTKSYNMAGWRVGFMVGNAEIVAALTKLKSYLDYGIFTPIQVAAINALKAGTEPCREIASVYQSRMEVLLDGLLKLGFEVERPRATMYLWARLPGRYMTAGSMKFTEMLLEEAGVAVSPGVGFGPEGEGYLRFALVENEERTRQAIRNMRRMFQPRDSQG
jgi:alanine-synthesizing transaminase